MNTYDITLPYATALHGIGCQTPRETHREHGYMGLSRWHMYEIQNAMGDRGYAKRLELYCPSQSVGSSSYTEDDHTLTASSFRDAGACAATCFPLGVPDVVCLSPLTHLQQDRGVEEHGVSLVRSPVPPSGLAGPLRAKAHLHVNPQECECSSSEEEPQQEWSATALVHEPETQADPPQTAARVAEPQHDQCAATERQEESPPGSLQADRQSGTEAPSRSALPASQEDDTVRLHDGATTPSVAAGSVLDERGLANAHSRWSPLRECWLVPEPVTVNSVSWQAYLPLHQEGGEEIGLSQVRPDRPPVAQAEAQVEPAHHSATPTPRSTAPGPTASVVDGNGAHSQALTAEHQPASPLLIITHGQPWTSQAYTVIAAFLKRFNFLPHEGNRLYQFRDTANFCPLQRFAKDLKAPVDRDLSQLFRMLLLGYHRAPEALDRLTPLLGVPPETGVIHFLAQVEGTMPMMIEFQAAGGDISIPCHATLRDGRPTQGMLPLTDRAWLFQTSCKTAR